MKIKQKNILDELLVMRTQNGDMEAFALLVKRWHPALLKQAFRLTRDSDASKDVAQEAWHSISKGISSLRSASAFKTWAFRIVSNKSVNWVRSRQKIRELKVEADETIENEDNEIESVVIIKRALAELPLKSRTILSMFYLDEHSLKEIAEILNLSEGTVKSRLFYARKALKEKFEKFKQ